MSYSQVISLEDYRRGRDHKDRLADSSGHYGGIYASAATFVIASSPQVRRSFSSRGAVSPAIVVSPVRTAEVPSYWPTAEVVPDELEVA